VRLKHVRQLQVLPNWERRANDLAVLADAVEDLVQVHSLPLSKPEDPAVPTAAAPVQSESQQLHTCVMLVKSIARKSEAFGCVGESGDEARTKLKSALAAIEALAASL
jgi:hypothetical protein